MDVPAAVVTVTSTGADKLAACATAGARAMSVVADRTWKNGEATPPNDTLLTSTKFVPVIMTRPPPVAGPVDVLSAVMVGTAAAGMYWKWSACEGADRPREFWTVTSIVPEAGWEACTTEGVTAVIVPSSLIVND